MRFLPQLLQQRARLQVSKEGYGEALCDVQSLTYDGLHYLNATQSSDC